MFWLSCKDNNFHVFFIQNIVFQIGKWWNYNNAKSCPRKRNDWENNQINDKAFSRHVGENQNSWTNYLQMVMMVQRSLVDAVTILFKIGRP